MPIFSVERFNQLHKMVQEAIERQKVSPDDAYISLEPSINGIRVDVIPRIWRQRECTGSHQEGEPQPEHLGYW